MVKSRLAQRIFLFIVVLFAAFFFMLDSPKIANAANPTTVNFQGKVVNANGTNVSNGTYTFVFKLYTASSGGSPIWTETDSLTVTNGIFQVDLGASCPFFTSNACNNSTPIDFGASSSIYMGMTFNSDPNGEMSPRMQFQSVPYAFNSDKVGGLTASQLVQLSPGSQQTGNLNVSGSGTFDGGLTITGSLGVDAAGNLTLGSSSNAASILLNDGGGNAITIDVPTLASSYTLTLPTDAPVVSQCLKSDSVTASQLIFGSCSAGGGGGDAYLANTQTFTGRNAFTGSGNGTSLYGVLFKNSTNSATAFAIQSATSNNLFAVDTFNGKVKVSNADLILDGIASSDPTIPTNPSASVGSNSSGSFSGAAGTTYFYKVTSINGTESPASAEVSVDSTDFTPVSVPASAPSSSQGTGSGLTGTYCYKYTYVTANGETTASSASNCTTISNKRMSVAGITTGPTGTTDRNLYRTTDGGSTYYFVTNIGNNTTTTYTDTTADGSLGAVEPTQNTARTNTNSISITFDSVAGATSYNVYRGTSSGGEDHYQNTSSSPFTDTGSTGTAGTPTDPTPVASTLKLGINNPTPTVALDVVGKALLKSQTDAADAVLIQSNTTSDTLFTADTTNNRLKVGNATGTDTNTTIFVVDSATADPTTNKVNGAIYYNSSNGKFRCYQANSWTDCIPSAGSGDVYLANTQTFVGNNTFNGTVLVNPNSTTAFRVQNASSVTILGVDTNDSNGRIFSTVANGASAIGFKLDTPSYTTSGAKLLSVQNNAAEKFSIDKDGVLVTSGTITSGTTSNVGSLILKDGTGNNRNVTLAAAALSGSYSLTLPTSGPSTSQCIKTDSVTASQLTFVTCASGDAVLASNQTFSGRNTFTGSGNGSTNYGVLFKNASNSSTAFSVQKASGTEILNVDTTNSYVTVGNADFHLYGVTVDPNIPASPGVSAGSNTGGSLSGAAGTTYYYKVTSINGTESDPSTEVSINGASFTPLSAPGTAPASSQGTGSGLTGTYCYKYTFVTANGETTASSASNCTTISNKRMSVSGISAGPAGTTDRNVYRTTNGGSTYFFLTAMGNNATTTLTDSAADGTLGAAEPVSNTGRTNTNNASVTFSSVGGATSYNVYRGTSSDGEDHYQNTASSPFTDTGATGTAGTPPVPASQVLKLGINTNAPSAALDVVGDTLLSTSTNSTTAFRIQNASSTTIFGVDTNDSNGRIFTGIANGASAIGFKLDTPSYTTSGAKLLTVNNNGTQKFSIDKDGNTVAAGGLTISNVNASDASTVLSLKNSSGTSIFGVKDLSTNFGALALAGAFASNMSSFDEEFAVNKNVTAITADTTTGLGDTSAYTYDTFTGTATTYSTPTSVVNGVGRFTLPATSGTGFVFASGRTVANYNGSYLKANLPVVQMKVKPSSTANTNDYRIGLMGVTTAASGTNDASPSDGIYFSNENGTSWVGVVRSGGANVGTVTCSGSISTTQFATLLIQVESASQVRFLVDNDASDGINYLDCGTVGVNSNPTAALTLGLMYEHTVASAATFDVDYMRTWQDDSPLDASSQNLDTTTDTSSTTDVSPLVVASKGDEATTSTMMDFTSAAAGDTVFDNNVYIKGTLYADKIKANQIEGLEIFTDKLDSLQAKLDQKDPKNNDSAEPSATKTAKTSGLTTAGNIVSKNGAIQILDSLGKQVALIDSAGNANFEGSLHTASAQVNGALVVGGDVNISGLSTFEKLATFIGKVVFRQDVEFQGHIAVGQDSAGYALIRKGEDQVHVKYVKSYDKTPIVSANIVNGKYAAYTIDSVQPDGFDIKLQTTATEDTTFNWTAVGSKDSLTASNPLPPTTQ